jgi:hypothetical protein
MHGGRLIFYGTGAIKGYGGTWNNTTKTFTIAEPTAVNAGTSDAITTAERLLFTDTANGKHMGASFGVVTGSPTFSATWMSTAELVQLSATPGYTGTVLSAWDFTTNYTGDQVMLSFDIGLGAQDPHVWHLYNGNWSQFTPDLTTYDSNGNFSFTTTQFSGFAVTATSVVPEPATGVLLILAALPLICRRKHPYGSM